MVDCEWLVENKNGLILLLGVKDGDLGKVLLKGNFGFIEFVVSFYK